MDDSADKGGKQVQSAKIAIIWLILYNQYY